MWKYAKELIRVPEDKQKGHEHIPNKKSLIMGADISINSHGHRGVEVPTSKPPGTVRIMMLGDSLTLGWGVPSKETIANRLQVLLNMTHNNKNFEIINSGVANTNTEMQVEAFLDKGRLFSPDIVVLNYYINDAEPIPRPKKNIFMKYSAAYVFFSLRLESLLGNILKSKNFYEYYMDLYKEGKNGWGQTQKALSRLAEYCRKNEVRLIVVNYPELHQLAPYPFTDVSQKIESQAEKLQVPYLNLMPSLQDKHPEDLWVSKQDQHPNSFACSLIAPAIQKALEKYFPKF